MWSFMKCTAHIKLHTCHVRLHFGGEHCFLDLSVKNLKMFFFFFSLCPFTSFVRSKWPAGTSSRSPVMSQMPSLCVDLPGSPSPGRCVDNTHYYVTHYAWVSRHQIVFISVCSFIGFRPLTFTGRTCLKVLQMQTWNNQQKCTNWCTYILLI